MSYLNIYEEKTGQGKVSIFISNNELPEGVVVADVGSIYIYTGSFVRIYYKVSSNNTANGWRLINQRFGTTGSRPELTSVDVGTLYYDTTINRPLWYTVNGWRDAYNITQLNSVATSVEELRNDFNSLLEKLRV